MPKFALTHNVKTRSLTAVSMESAIWKTTCTHENMSFIIWELNIACQFQLAGESLMKFYLC